MTWLTIALAGIAAAAPYFTPLVHDPYASAGISAAAAVAGSLYHYFQPSPTQQ